MENSFKYTVTETTEDIRASLAIRFYCEEINKCTLRLLKDYEADILARRSIMAANAIIKKLNESQDTEEVMK